MGKELLFEIGTEEMPAGIIPQALKNLEGLAKERFESNRIDHGEIKVLGTPRRLFLYVRELSESQRDITEEKIGPSKKSAYDANGNPTGAAIGFAKALGVKLEEIRTVKREKGEYLSVKKQIKGEKTLSLLPAILKDIITSLPFPKFMRWGSFDLAFTRPIHWILVLFGGKVVTFSLGNFKSSSLTRGHRFLGSDPFPVEDYSSYIKKTRKAYVIIDPEERKAIIKDGLKRVGDETGSRVLENEELIDEVTYLVEYPVVLHGEFNKEFLKLPREVLVHAMRSHQRYFSMVDDEDRLLPRFVMVTNTPVGDIDVVVKGNERVLKARLEDAKFYFKEDQKVSLHKRVDELKGVIFQSRLGTSYEKVIRFKELAHYICEKVAVEKVDVVDRAAYLCKADLVTGMVGEFSDLQGVMGREYALLSGESEEIAGAIYEHYLPTSSTDRVPSGITGAIVSIADKLDTIVGCFGIDLIPTGTADPHSLRRQVLGIIAIILEKGLSLSLSELIDKSYSLLQKKVDRPFEEVKEDVEEFFKSRWKNQLVTQGYPFDVVDAVLATSSTLDLLDAFERIKALRTFKRSPAFETLAIAFKRVANILKNVDSHTLTPELLETSAERYLYSAYLERKDEIEGLLKEGNYGKALERLSLLKGPVDTFFDEVLVMAEDERLRNNRLALLQAIGNMLYRIGDFSKISTT